MPRRRPSYGSQGVVESKRVGPPQSSSGHTVNVPSATRNRSSNHPSNVEQWLTSPTVANTDIPKKAVATFSSSSAPRSNMSRGQRLLRNRLRAPAPSADTTTTATSSSTSSSRPPQQPARGRPQEEPVSEIIQQRNGKRFTFDGVEQQNDRHRNPQNRHRPGMPSSNPPPPPPPKSPAARRPTNATPASTAPPPPTVTTQQKQKPHRQNVKPEVTPKPKSKPKKKLPFLKRHNATKDPTEEEISSSRRRPPKPETAHTRQTRKEQQQKRMLQQLAADVNEKCQIEPQPSSDVSISSSVTNYRFQDQGFLQQKTATHDRGNSSSSSVQSSSKEKTRSKSCNAIPEHAALSTGTSSAAQAFVWSSEAAIGKAKVKTSKSSSPNSCSITAATSGSKSEDDISQLTDPDITTTPHTGQGISSHAETEKIKNLSKQQSRGGSGRRPIPPSAPRSMSFASHVPNTPVEDDDDRERYAIVSRNETPKIPPFQDDSSANGSFVARINPKQLRKTNRIKLHVYDLVENDTQLDLFGCYFPLGQCFNGLNSTLHSMGTGAYHVGIEINGIEYAYGANSTNGLTGVFTCMPKNSPGYQYRQSIDFGNRLINRNDNQSSGGQRGKAGGSKHQSSSSSSSSSTPVDGRDIVRSMAYEYMGTEYDLLRKNCCTFAYDACLRLGVREDEIPSWFHNLAAVGAVTQDAANSTLAPITQAFK